MTTNKYHKGIHQILGILYPGHSNGSGLRFPVKRLWVWLSIYCMSAIVFVTLYAYCFQRFFTGIFWKSTKVARHGQCAHRVTNLMPGHNPHVHVQPVYHSKCTVSMWFHNRNHVESHHDHMGISSVWMGIPMVTNEEAVWRKTTIFPLTRPKKKPIHQIHERPYDFTIRSIMLCFPQAKCSWNC
jgi:hypothetical protein